MSKWQRLIPVTDLKTDVSFKQFNKNKHEKL